MLTAQFHFWGVRSEAVQDGPTALQALYRARDAGNPFRAAILDMQMPGMDGVTLARTIKAGALDTVSACLPELELQFVRLKTALETEIVQRYN